MYPFRKIIKSCRKRGAEVVRPSHGSHWKVQLAGFRSYPISAHNGDKSKIHKSVVRGLCRNFEWNEEEFISEL